MLELDNVGLVCLSTIYIEQSIYAIEHSCSNIRFNNVKFFTNRTIKSDIFDCIEIPNMLSIMDYNNFVLYNLGKYITSKYILIVQWDGFVINPNMWDPMFLNYDYIGARWINNVCGNGGFSLRSKKLYDAIDDNRDVFSRNVSYDIPRFNEENVTNNEDVVICYHNRKFLESFGIKFCNNDLCDKFSVESRPYNNSFGFHGFGITSNLPDIALKNKNNRG
jgi:hypothetical protein